MTADEISARYTGDDGEGHCMLALSDKVGEYFAPADRFEPDELVHALTAAAHVCDRIDPSSPSAMRSAALAIAGLTGRSTMTIMEEAASSAPDHWANLTRDHPNLINQMRRK